MFEFVKVKGRNCFGNESNSVCIENCNVMIPEMIPCPLLMCGVH